MSLEHTNAPRSPTFLCEAILGSDQSPVAQHVAGPLDSLTYAPDMTMKRGCLHYFKPQFL